MRKRWLSFLANEDGIVGLEFVFVFWNVTKSGATYSKEAFGRDFFNELVEATFGLMIVGEIQCQIHRANLQWWRLSFL